MKLFWKTTFFPERMFSQILSRVTYHYFLINFIWMLLLFFHLSNDFFCLNKIFVTALWGCQNFLFNEQISVMFKGWQIIGHIVGGAINNSYMCWKFWKSFTCFNSWSVLNFNLAARKQNIYSDKKLLIDVVSYIILPHFYHTWGKSSRGKKMYSKIW